MALTLSLSASVQCDGAVPRLSAQGLASAMPHALWRGDAMGSHRAGGRPSGYAALDKELPSGGWPPSVLTELLWPQQGDGEFRLLAPVLSRLAGSGETIVLLAPPHLVFAPALTQLGIDSRQLLLIQSEKPGDRLWAVEQVLRSASFGALLCWLPQVRPDHLRRLQLAAGAGEGLVFVFRSALAQQEASPAPLRLLCRAAPAGRVAVEVFKRRGPPAAGPVVIETSLPPMLERALMRRVERQQAIPVFASASASASTLTSAPVSSTLPIELPRVMDRPLPAALAAGPGLSSLA